MKAKRAVHMLLIGIALAAAVSGVAHAADYHHVHLAVPSPTEAVAWYERYMECEAIPERRDAVSCGGVEIHFDVLITVGGSQGTGVNHIGFSFADLTGKMTELEGVGVGGRGVRLQRFDDGSTLSDVPGLFTHGFVFDPWGTRIELVEDPNYLGFHHVHLSSTDPEASLDWYRENLGGERARLNGQLDGLLFDNVWLIVSAHPEGTPPPAPTEGRSIDHIGFLVSDLDEAAADMSERGVALEGTETGRTSARRAFIAGPDNVALAVVEPGWEGVVTDSLVADIGAVPLGEPYTAPRTPWGTPDLQGVWTSNRAHGIPLERPQDLADIEELTPEEAAARRERGTLGSIWGYEREWRDTTLGLVGSSPSTQVAMVVDPPDGRVPPLTPEAQARTGGGRGGRGGLPAGPEDLGNYVRCITRGLPSLMMPGIYNNGLQIVQSPGHVAIQKEMIHETRIVPTGPKPNLGENLTQWLGDSRGRWEGDTLVVEVTNFNGRAAYRNSSTAMKLTERFTRIGPETLMYEFTVDDPATWTRPWTAMFTFEKDDEQYELVEYACHEGNYGMTNILNGARAQELAADEDTGR